ncbi:N-glycosidase [Trametes pubescens]|uniref:N-glycosidase n=1 Tax=Trametes pubescens TaxID=154538 RepID=A0A1M2W3X0_TRAPU|nr:N-glycosidase [Trametes pubescens]
MSNAEQAELQNQSDTDLPVYFWKPEQEYGWASQWYHSPFTAHVTLPSGEEREALFPTAEHWMMAQKALLFGDQAIFERIIPSTVAAQAPPTTAEPAISNPGGPVRRTRSSHKHAATVGPVVKARPRPRYPSAKECKSLGRKVQGFEDAVWTRERAGIVREGTLHKFRQHPGIRAALLATGGRELVEASPRDRIWGIGFGRAGAERVDREAWGLNLLGRALMEVRAVLRAEAVEGRM